MSVAPVDISTKSSILIVDDNPKNIGILREMLRKNKYSIMVATSGKRAIELCLSQPPSLILLDIMMPELDGYETCKSLKINPITKNIPIIFVTARYSDTDIVKGFQVGGVDYISKPISQEVLNARIATQLKINNLLNNIHLEKEKLEMVVSSTCDSIISTDSSGIIQYANNIFFKLLNKNAKQVINSNITQHLALSLNNNHINILQLIKQCLDRKEVISIIRKTSLILHNEQFYLIEGNIAPIININNQPIGTVITIRNIEDQIELEKALINAEKIKTFGAILSRITNEIKTPLSIIVQGCQNIIRRLNNKLPDNIKAANNLGTDMKTISKYMDDRDITEFLENMRQAGNKAVNILSSLLQITELSYHPKISCDLIQIIEKALSLAQDEYHRKYKIASKTINIKTNFSNNLPKLYCNGIEIQQAFYNIFTNAIDAMLEINDEAILKIEVTTNKDKNFIIKITDNGIGIDPELLNKVTEPFFTTKEIGDGIGLGLTVTHSIIVNKHFGELNIKSNGKNGTLVEVTLPMQQNYD